MTAPEPAVEFDEFLFDAGVFAERLADEDGPYADAVECFSTSVRLTAVV